MNTDQTTDHSELIEQILADLYDGIDAGAQLRRDARAWGRLCGKLASSHYTSREVTEYKKLVGERLRELERQEAKDKAAELAREGRRDGTRVVPLFELGDHVELSARLLGDLTKESHGEEPPAYGFGQLHTYGSDGIWRPVPDAELSARVQAWSGAQILVGEHPNGDPKLRPLKLRAGDITGSISLATSRCAAWQRHSDCRQPDGSTGWLETSPRGVSFADCFVLIEPSGQTLAMSVSAHSPEHRARFGFDFPLPIGRAATPKFERYLRDIWGGLEDFEGRCAVLQEFAGAALLGLGPHYGKALLLKGAPGTGKSTFLEILAACMPPGGVTSIPPQRFDDPQYTADLSASRLNTVFDLSSDAIKDREGVKGIVHGEPITARRVFERVLCFRPEAAHAYGCNDYPSVPGADKAFFDRWLILRLEDDRVWRTDATSGEDSAEDRRLSQQIIDEELPGVVAWAIEGARRLIDQDRYTHLPSMTSWLREWGGEADAVGAWLDERVERFWTARDAHADDVSWEDVATLFDDFTSFCEKAKFKPTTKRTFSKRVRGAGVASKRSNGIKLAIKLESAW